jgi:hypothetical protein
MSLNIGATTPLSARRSASRAQNLPMRRGRIRTRRRRDSPRREPREAAAAPAARQRRGPRRRTGRSRAREVRSHRNCGRRSRRQRRLGSARVDVSEGIEVGQAFVCDRSGRTERRPVPPRKVAIGVARSAQTFARGAAELSRWASRMNPQGLATHGGRRGEAAPRTACLKAASRPQGRPQRGTETWRSALPGAAEVGRSPARAPPARFGLEDLP